MAITFTVPDINICVKQLLILSCRAHKRKKHVAVNRTKTDVHIGFLKLCTAAVHADTE